MLLYINTELCHINMVTFSNRAGMIQCYVGLTMKFSEWTLYFLVTLCSQHIPGIYGGDSAVKKWTSNGLKMQLLMVRVCNIYAWENSLEMHISKIHLRLFVIKGWTDKVH